jgi:5'-nucleotidase
MFFTNKGSMKFLKFLLILLIAKGTDCASAKLIHIVHTNDLHSFFETARNGKGGYARIKTLVDRLKADAKKNDMPFFFFDAGDFGEGSSYYFSNQGVDSLRALDLLGVDVTVLGNHDYMLGGHELARQMDQARLKTKILSANLQGKKRLGLEEKMPSFVDFHVDGMSLRVFGLSTPEIHYQYPLRPLGFIAPAQQAGLEMGRKARKDGVDFLIALTHIGFDRDVELASRSSNISMIIGGHSHKQLNKPAMIENLQGDLVPIFQTGAHGIAIGSIIVDIQGNGDYKLIDYKLYHINEEIPEDHELEKFVESAYQNREKYFNRSWDEVVGLSDIPLTGLVDGNVKDGRSCWSQHIARMTKTAAKADLGFQFALLQGEEIPAGLIRFGDIVDNFPHFRQWGDKGWIVTRAKVNGLLLKTIITQLTQAEDPMDLTIDGHSIIDGTIFINGKEINPLGIYTIALPSEISYAFTKTSLALQNLVLMDLELLEDAPYWKLVEEYLKNNSPLNCLVD